MFFFIPFLTACFVPAALVAQTQLQEVEVRDQREHESRTSPSSFTTVIHPAAQPPTMRRTSEILDRNAGIRSTDFGGLGQLSTVSIRGSSAEQVLVFMDGVRINTSQRGSVDFATIPLDSIQDIEVLRGGNSAQFGADAVGGVINITTKKPTDKRSFDAQITGGSFSTLRATASLRQPLGARTSGESNTEQHRRGDIIFSATHLSSKGNYPFRTSGVSFAGASPIAGGQDFTRIHNESISEDALIKFGWNITDRVKLQLSNDFNWINRQVPGTEEDTVIYYPANPLEAHEQIFRNTSAAELALADVGVSGFGWKLGLTNLFDHDHFTDPTPVQSPPINVTFLNTASSGYSLWSYAMNTDRESLLARLRYQFDLDTVDDSSPLAGTPLLGSHIRRVNALAADAQLGVLDDRVRLFPAGRAEHASDRGTLLTWKLGTALQPAQQMTLKGNAHFSARYPTFGELYFPDQGYIRGNPNLNNEKALGWDVGFVVTPPRTRVEMVFFQSFIDNSILFVPISGTTIAPLNTGRAHAKGIECAVAAAPFKGLDLSLNYTWLDARFSGNGLRLPGRPPHALNASIIGTLLNTSLFVDAQYLSKYPINFANTVQLSARTTFDAGVTAHFSKQKWFSTLEMKDITDVQTYDARGFPLPRRSLWLTVGVKV